MKIGEVIAIILIIVLMVGSYSMCLLKEMIKNGKRRYRTNRR